MLGGLTASALLFATAQKHEQDCTLGDCYDSTRIDETRMTVGALIGGTGLLAGLMMITQSDFTTAEPG